MDGVEIIMKVLNINNENDNLGPLSCTVHSGELVKRGRVFKTWKRRVFSLVTTPDGDSLLGYAADGEKLKGVIDLSEPTIVELEPTGISWPSAAKVGTRFALRQKDRILYMHADSLEETQEWIYHLRNVVHNSASDHPIEFDALTVEKPTFEEASLDEAERDAMNRIASEQTGAFVLLDLRHLYDKENWDDLAADLWDSLGRRVCPPWVRLVTEESIKSTRFVMISHKWHGPTCVARRTPTRDWWCAAVATEYFGNNTELWEDQEEPVWVWCDKLSNPQDEGTWSRLKSFTMAHFGTVSRHSCVFAVFEGFTIIPWAQCRQQITTITAKLGERISGQETWRAAGAQETVVNTLLQLEERFPGLPSLLLVDGTYDERAWCQVELAARLGARNLRVFRPLMHMVHKDESDQAILGLLPFAHFVAEHVGAILNIDKKVLLNANRNLSRYSPLSLCVSDFVRSCIPNIDYGGSVLGILTCSSVTNPEDLEIILPNHALNVATAYKQTRGRIVDQIVGNDGSVALKLAPLHRNDDAINPQDLAANVKAFVQCIRGVCEWSEQVFKGCIGMAWISAHEQTRNVCWKHYNFMVAIGVMIVALPQTSNDLYQSLEPFDAKTRSSSARNLLVFCDRLLDYAGLPSLHPSIFDTPEMLEATASTAEDIWCARLLGTVDSVKWAVVRAADSLGGVETHNGIMERSIPLQRPEKKLGALVLTSQNWANVDTEVDWDEYEIEVTLADSRVKFDGLNGKICKDSKFRSKGLTPVGVDETFCA